MRFYKAKIILTTSFLVVNLINTTANAVQLGQRCAVVGATFLQDGRLYTCLSNKTWGRGILQAAPEVVTPIPIPLVAPPTPEVVAPTPTPVVVAPTPTPVLAAPVLAAPTPTNTMTDKNGNTLVAPKDISIRCKSMSTKYDITNVTGPNPKCPLNYRLLSPNDPEYNGPIGGVISTTPVVSPTPTPDSVGTALIPEYVWCVQSSTGRSVRSVTPYKPSCPKGYTARDYYGIPTEEVIKLGEPNPSPSPLITKVKVCYKPTDTKRVNGVKVLKQSVTGEQPKCPAGYK
jgi:hypothetical protein